MEIKMLQVAPLGTNCYLVCDEAEKVCAVVDPGGDAVRIATVVKDAGYQAACILLTHGHYDHTGGVAGLRKLWPEVPVYLSHKDRFPAGTPEAQLFLPLEGEIRDYGEGDTVTVGSLQIRVLSTPGHSEGSVCLLCGDALIAGDTLFAGSCGRIDLPGGDRGAMLFSMERLAEVEADYRLFPGHGRSSTLKQEQKTNPSLKGIL